ACYYDADDLKDVQGWLDIAASLRKVRGFMYTPWEKKYALLPDFGDLLHKPVHPRPSATAPAQGRECARFGTRQSYGAFDSPATAQSGRGLPHSKTLPQYRLPDAFHSVLAGTLDAAPLHLGLL